MVSAAQQQALERIEQTPVECVIGIDEVGMGCWAGPVVVAGVVMPKDWRDPDVKDSKQLTPKRRKAARDKVLAAALAHVVLEGSNALVDRLGVRRVQELLTEGVALYCLRRFPDALIIQDGDIPVMVGNMPQKMVWLAKADVLVPAVSAASVLAKVHRYTLMHAAHKTYPAYGFDRNVGYGTALHMRGLEAAGACPLHRMSYSPVKRLSLRHRLRQDQQVISCTGGN
jgi:ribonuclease HII